MQRQRRTRQLEVRLGTVTLVVSTGAYLLDAPALGAVSLVLGGIAYGIVLAKEE